MQIKVCNCPAKIKKEKIKIVFQKSLALDICFPFRTKEKWRSRNALINVITNLDEKHRHFIFLLLIYLINLIENYHITRSEWFSESLWSSWLSHPLFKTGSRTFLSDKRRGKFNLWQFYGDKKAHPLLKINKFHWE